MAARSERRWAIPSRSGRPRPSGRPERRARARRTSWSCCSTMSASPTSAATARRSRRRPSTPSPQRGLRYTGFHTTAMCSTTRAALLTGRNHHSVGVGCLANFDFGLSRLSRQDRAGGRHPGRDAAAARLSQLHAGQVARHAAHRDRARPARSTAGRSAAASTASTASWTPRPTSTRPSWCATTRRSIRRAPSQTGYHLTADLVDQAIRYLADHVADDAEIAVADLGGARRLPCAAPGAGRPDRQVRRAVRQRLGRRARPAPRAAEGDSASCRQDTRLPPRNDAVRPWAELPGRRAAALHAPAGGLRRDARACRPASRAAGRLPRDSRASSTTRWSSSCPTTAPARRAGRSAWSMPWVPTTCAASRSRRRSRASTTSAGPTRIPTSRWAGRWRPTRRCAATSRTPMAAASAIRW